MLRTVTIFSLAAACLTLSACASSSRFEGQPVVEFAGDEGLPPPTLADTLVDERPYQIGPFDRITVTVFGVPELSAGLLPSNTGRNGIQVDSAGQVALPLIGQVQAAGLTPSELSSLITERLRGAYVRDPRVTVNVEEAVSQSVTVGGEVKMPGTYPIRGKMTLVRAIAEARGLDEFARREDVVVFRTVNDQRLAALYNLRAIDAGYYQDPELYPGDVVVVGESQARRLFKDFVSFGPSLLTTVITVLLR